MRLDPAAERGQQPMQRPAKIAEPDDAHGRPRQHLGVTVAVEQPLLLGVQEGRVLAVDVARQAQRHAQRHLGHRGGKDPAGGQHMDPPAEAFLIVDVRKEVGLDIEDRPQPGRQRQPVRPHRLLRDQDLGLRQMPGIEGLAVLALPFDDLMLRPEGGQLRVREDVIGGPGVGVVQHAHRRVLRKVARP
jgi:hypothetical protein